MLRAALVLANRRHLLALFSQSSSLLSVELALGGFEPVWKRRCLAIRWVIIYVLSKVAVGLLSRLILVFTFN